MAGSTTTQTQTNEARMVMNMMMQSLLHRAVAVTGADYSSDFSGRKQAWM